MTKEMERVIRNIPIVETHGQYVVGAHHGQGVPVITVYHSDDEQKSVHLVLDLAHAVITIVPSLSCKDTDSVWNTIIGLLLECGVCDERNRIVKFEDTSTLMRELDHFFELLETI